MTEYIFYGIIGLVVLLFIWHELIQSATRSKEIARLIKTQNDLIRLLLEKQGVDKDTIESILSMKK